MVFHNHSNSFRQFFSVTEGRRTIAVMKPFAALRGWWVLEGRGIEWVNPLARNITAVRAQAKKGEWPIDANWSAYNRTPRFMLVKGKRAALAEMKALSRQTELRKTASERTVMAEHDQSFASEQEWINKGRSWLTRRGPNMRAICYDTQGRLCTCGGDFMRATKECAFPIRWIWPDQVATLASETGFVAPDK